MPATDAAIVVIAVAVATQTVIMAAALIGASRAWRRMQADVRELQAVLDRRLEMLSGRIDEAIVDARLAARAVETLATRADGFVQDASSAAHSVKTAVTMPRALLATGAASAARWLASKWGSRRPRALGRAETVVDTDVF